MRTNVSSITLRKRFKSGVGAAIVVSLIVGCGGRRAQNDISIEPSEHDVDRLVGVVHLPAEDGLPLPRLQTSDGTYLIQPTYLGDELLQLLSMRVAVSGTVRRNSATDLPLIVFQYGDELAYSLDTLVDLAEDIPTVCAVKDWSTAQDHERHIRVLHSLPRPVNVLSTNSAWLMSSLRKL